MATAECSSQVPRSPHPLWVPRPRHSPRTHSEGTTLHQVLVLRWVVPGASEAHTPHQIDTTTPQGHYCPSNRWCSEAKDPPQVSSRGGIRTSGQVHGPDSGSQGNCCLIKSQANRESCPSVLQDSRRTTRPRWSTSPHRGRTWGRGGLPAVGTYCVTPPLPGRVHRAARERAQKGRRREASLLLPSSPRPSVAKASQSPPSLSLCQLMGIADPSSATADEDSPVCGSPLTLHSPPQGQSSDLWWAEGLEQSPSAMLSPR